MLVIDLNEIWIQEWLCWWDQQQFNQTETKVVQLWVSTHSLWLTLSMEAEDSPLLEAATYQQLVKTNWEDLVCAAVICRVCRFSECYNEECHHLGRENLKSYTML
jgi:hypothetical protein